MFLNFYMAFTKVIFTLLIKKVAFTVEKKHNEHFSDASKVYFLCRSVSACLPLSDKVIFFNLCCMSFTLT